MIPMDVELYVYDLSKVRQLESEYFNDVKLSLRVSQGSSP